METGDFFRVVVKRNKARILPTRNGNPSPCNVHSSVTVARILPTRNGNNYQGWSTKMFNKLSTDPTYKEWKLLLDGGYGVCLLASTDPTYKEWKPINEFVETD